MTSSDNSAIVLSSSRVEFATLTSPSMGIGLRESDEELSGDLSQSLWFRETLVRGVEMGIRAP
jgi:hypothetical protein